MYPLRNCIPPVAVSVMDLLINTRLKQEPEPVNIKSSALNWPLDRQIKESQKYYLQTARYQNGFRSCVEFPNHVYISIFLFGKCHCRKRTIVTSWPSHVFRITYPADGATWRDTPGLLPWFCFSLTFLFSLLNCYSRPWTTGWDCPLQMWTDPLS